MEKWKTRATIEAKRAKNTLVAALRNRILGDPRIATFDRKVLGLHIRCFFEHGWPPLPVIVAAVMVAT